MASCLDVAEYILREMGPVTAMKLQKLVYYSQAWSLVWDEEPIFEEEIQAWANGKQRIWGIKDRNILKVLWWDPDHEVCPSLKKYT